MLSVQQAASQLGVSGARVRAMLKDGILEGEKVGRTWVVSAHSVACRLQQDVHAGRPRAQHVEYTQALPDVDVAHALFDDARKTLAGCYSSAFLRQARTEEEEAFWLCVSDFFLQRRQADLVAKGVY